MERISEIVVRKDYLEALLVALEEERRQNRLLHARLAAVNAESKICEKCPILENRIAALEAQRQVEKDDRRQKVALLAAEIVSEKDKRAKWEKIAQKSLESRMLSERSAELAAQNAKLEKDQLKRKLAALKVKYGKMSKIAEGSLRCIKQMQLERDSDLKDRAPVQLKDILPTEPFQQKDKERHRHRQHPDDSLRSAAPAAAVVGPAKIKTRPPLDMQYQPVVEELKLKLQLRGRIE